jgi:hypothetical protein
MSGFPAPEDELGLVPQAICLWNCADDEGPLPAQAEESIGGTGSVTDLDSSVGELVVPGENRRAEKRKVFIL